MEVEVVMVGPTFNIGQLVAVPTAATPPPPPCIFINAEGDNDPDVEESGGVSLISSMIGSPSEKSPDYSSDSSSSSIGAPSDDDEEDDEEDNTASSKGALASLDSIEESLPFKKGLSNHFSGKSKSFGNLSDMGCCTEVSKMKDVEKTENPFNKRRRILMANKLFNSARKSSFYGWSNNPKSMPVLAALDELEEDEKELGARYGGDHGSSSSSSSSSSLMSPSKQPSEHQDSVESSSRRFKSGLGFKSQSCFALSDLQEEEDDDDDDDHDHD